MSILYSIAFPVPKLTEYSINEYRASGEDLEAQHQLSPEGVPEISHQARQVVDSPKTCMLKMAWVFPGRIWGMLHVKVVEGE